MGFLFGGSKAQDPSSFADEQDAYTQQLAAAEAKQRADYLQAAFQQANLSYQANVTISNTPYQGTTGAYTVTGTNQYGQPVSQPLYLGSGSGHTHTVFTPPRYGGIGAVGNLVTTGGHTHTLGTYILSGTYAAHDLAAEGPGVQITFGFTLEELSSAKDYMEELQRVA